MKYAAILLLAVSVDVVADGVGAFTPHQVNTAPTHLAAVDVDTGANNRWAAHPTQNLLSNDDTEKFEIRVEGFDAGVNKELSTLISEKIDRLLAQQE